MTNQQPKATIVLGAGAPNAPLMSGFLDAIYSSGKAFNNFFTAGGGALIALSLIAPKQKDHLKNLRAIMDSAVADEIYDRFPVNYKVFRKNSPLMEPMQKYFDLFKTYEGLIPSARWRRVYKDLVDLGAVVATPGGIPGGKDPSICAPFSLLPKLVDFKKLDHFNGLYRLNAYNIDTGKIELFPKGLFPEKDQKLTEQEFIAGLSYPFIYPPGQLNNGKLYYEGADVDPLCVFQLIKTMMQMNYADKARFETLFPSPDHTIVMVDILGTLAKAIVRKPTGLWDAYGISMLTSIIASARWNKELFRAMYMSPEDKIRLKVDNEFFEEEIDVRQFNEFLHYQIEVYMKDEEDMKGDADKKDKEKAKPPKRYGFHEIRFDVPQSHWPKLMEWSYSNLSVCYQIGKETGEKWLRQKVKDKHNNDTEKTNADLLPDRVDDGVNPVNGTAGLVTA